MLRCRGHQNSTELRLGGQRRQPNHSNHTSRPIPGNTVHFFDLKSHSRGLICQKRGGRQRSVVSPHYPPRTDRSFSSTRSAAVRRARTQFGKRAFSVCGPEVWKSFPTAVFEYRQLSSFQTFTQVTFS